MEARASVNGEDVTSSRSRSGMDKLAFYRNRDLPLRLACETRIRPPERLLATPLSLRRDDSLGVAGLQSVQYAEEGGRANMAIAFPEPHLLWAPSSAHTTPSHESNSVDVRRPASLWDFCFFTPVSGSEKT